MIGHPNADRIEPGSGLRWYVGMTWKDQSQWAGEKCIGESFRRRRNVRRQLVNLVTVDDMGDERIARWSSLCLVNPRDSAPIEDGCAEAIDRFCREGN